MRVTVMASAGTFRTTPRQSIPDGMGRDWHTRDPLVASVSEELSRGALLPFAPFRLGLTLLACLFLLVVLAL